MIDSYMKSAQLVAWSSMMFMSYYLLFGSIPVNDASKQYRISRKLIGSSYLILCMQFFLQWYFNIRTEISYIASALNISFFFFSGSFMAYAYISMLDNKFLNKKRIISDFVICLSASAAIWGSIAFLPAEIYTIVLKISAIALFIYIAKLSVDFLIIYKRAIKKIHNYYADNVSLFIKWMSKSIFLKIATGILSPIVAFFTDWSIFGYLIVNILLFFYIFSCFIDYMPNLEIINNALNSDIDDKNLNIDENKQLLGNQTEQIIEQLNQWIENKGYIIQGLTINTLSLELRINKTYLSAHINNKYKMTFREWINSLRIEYAKEIMTEDPTRINDEIAKLAGYTSRTHFIKVFTDLEGQSPSNWKNNNICQIQKTLP